MNGLIVIVKPAPDESPIGYMRRLAMSNGYAGWKALLRYYGFAPTLNAASTSIDELEQALGLGAGWIASLLTVAGTGATLYDPFFARIHADPICPQCLAGSEHLRHAWSHCFVTACPVHQRQLVDQCPQCLTMLHSSRQGIALCDCGYDLRSGETAHAKPAECWVSARLAGDMRRIDGVDELGAPPDYRLLAKLIFQLVARFDPAVKVRPAKVPRPKTVEDSQKFLAPMLFLLEDWRPRFSEHIGMRFAVGPESAASLSARLGPWYTNLHKLCRKPEAFAALWQVFSDSVLDNFGGVLRGQNGLNPSNNRQREYLSMVEAARLIGITATSLQQAVDEGQITANATRQGPNYKISMVSRHEVERVRSARDQWLSESQAAQTLAVASSVVRNLVRTGILEHDAHWRESALQAGPISSNLLKPLVGRVASFMVCREERETLTFDQLNARRTVDIKALASLYRAIFDGEVRAVGRGAESSLGSFVFSVADVRQYLGSAALSQGLTLLQLERVTGWKYESLSRWTDLGLLKSRHVVLQGRQARIVTIADFAEFRREWVPVAELARSSGGRASSVTARLEKRGIPVIGQTPPEKGPRRGGLVRLGDLMQIGN